LFSAICLNKAQSQSMSMQYAVNLWRVCPHFMKLSVWVFYVHNSNASIISAEHRPNSHKAFCKQCSL
jgi:hypothetical protein